MRYVGAESRCTVAKHPFPSCDRSIAIGRCSAIKAGALADEDCLTRSRLTLTVTDDDGATATDTTMVNVRTVSQGISTLANLVSTYNLGQGIMNALDAKLQNVLAALTAVNSGQRQDAINTLRAFVYAVQAQRGNLLTNTQADELVGLASRIIAVM